jgi:hypothetical protein
MQIAKSLWWCRVSASSWGRWVPYCLVDGNFPYQRTTSTLVFRASQNNQLKIVRVPQRHILGVACSHLSNAFPLYTMLQFLESWKSLSKWPWIIWIFQRNRTNERQYWFLIIHSTSVWNFL